MSVDRFFVVGRETSGDAVFMQTFLDGVMPIAHWGELRFADRYLTSENAKRAAENAPHRFESDGPAAVWRVEVTATKETT